MTRVSSEVTTAPPSEFGGARMIGSDRGLTRTHIDGDGQTSACLHANERWPASTNRGRRPRLVDVARGEQIANDRREGRAAHVHTPRQLGARNRLVLTNQIEHDAGVEIRLPLEAERPRMRAVG